MNAPGESLEERILPAITATFSPETGTLSVVGDSQNNVINLSQSVNGNILVNNGAIAITGGTPNVSNTNRIVAVGQGGNDQISLKDLTSQSISSVIIGGSGNDSLTGGAGRDFLLGGSGNDLIQGGDNVDRLLGGRGNDTLLGNRGNDVVKGQSGTDLLIWNNGDGSDVLEGGAGNDFVQVNGANGAGDDFRIAPNGKRVFVQRINLGLFTLDIGTTENLDINGQGGNDVIAGSFGLGGSISLDLDGGQGNDLLIGGDGADVLRGGAGNDTLIGNLGNDVTLGEKGNDLIIVNDGDGSDFLEGGSGMDVVQVHGDDSAGDDFKIDPNGNRVRFQRNNLGLFTLDIGTVETLDVNGQGGSDIIVGSIGLAALIELDLDGGAGNDLLIGGDGADVLRGGTGNDTLLGKFGNDVVLGENGNDLLIVNHGDGSDFLEGGEGVDTVQVNGSNADGDHLQVDPDGGRVRVIRNNVSPFNVNIGTTEKLDINGQDGSDVIMASSGLASLISLEFDGGSGNDLLIGGDGADVLVGGTGNDTLIGMLGNDLVFGQEGNDLLIVNSDDGNDLLEGGEGSDTVQVNGSNLAGDSFRIDPNGDQVRFRRTNLGLFTLDIKTTENLDVNSQGGNDLIIASEGLDGLINLDLDGGQGNDLIIGGDGADTLRGGVGMDTLIGGRGNDVVFGDEGNDLMIVNDGDGSDFLEGGAGEDTVEVNGSNTDRDEILISPNGNRVELQRTNIGLFTLDIGTSETIEINTLGGNDLVTGSTGLAALKSLKIDGGLGADILTGGDGNDLINGGDGNDLLRGRDGNDLLIGNQGDDLVFGDNGNDLIIHDEGDGNDLISGGLGYDTVQVTTGNLDDDIAMSPNRGAMRLERTNLSAFAIDIGSSEVVDLRSGDGNDNVVIDDMVGVRDLQLIKIDLGSGNDIMNASKLLSELSLFTWGGTGNDLLWGGSGNDLLLGEEGNDILIGGPGNDALNGGAGIDFIDGGTGMDIALNGETVINVP